MPPTTARSTIEPAPQHEMIAKATIEVVLGQPAALTKAVNPDLDALLSDDGLAERIAEQTKIATCALVHAAHCAKLLSDRHASVELTSDAARDAASGAAWDTAWSAAGDAAWALVVRDLIPLEHCRSVLSASPMSWPRAQTKRPSGLTVRFRGW